VLDVGCGFGISTLEAAEGVARSGRVVGVDISAACPSAHCSRRYGQRQLNFPLRWIAGMVMDATAWLVTAHR